MEIKLPDNLMQLAKIFSAHATLYVVGGAVRNSLLGYEVNDFDITSSLKVEQVEQILQNTDFEIVACYKRTGTVVIKNQNQTYEYTTFRKDSYPLKNGTHQPMECVFTSDINTDVKRRDFTCNALYYDILKGNIVDLVGGVEDIKNKILRSVREPSQTMSEDALRIMRLARFSVQLGFSIEKQTFEQTKKYCVGLKDISKDRICEELRLIFDAPNKYDSKKLGVKQSDGIRILVDLGAMQYIIPEIVDMMGVQQNKKYHIYDVYEHTLKTVDNLPSRLAMAGLLHDVAKPIMYKQYGIVYGHELLGEDVARQIMTNLKFSNKEIETTCTLVKMHMFNVDNKTKDSKCRVFIATYFDYIDDYVCLRRADGIATNPTNYDDSSALRILSIKEQMKKDELPISIKDLPINGNDLLKMGFEGKQIKQALEETLQRILKSGKKENKEEILRKLRRMV